MWKHCWCSAFWTSKHCSVVGWDIGEDLFAVLEVGMLVKVLLITLLEAGMLVKVLLIAVLVNIVLLELATTVFCLYLEVEGDFVVILFVIIIIILESAVQGRERVRTLDQSKDPNPTQPTHGRKKKIKR